jgi:hypothetical protein
MAITPPPNSNGGASGGSHDDLLDAVWGLYHPSLWLMVLTTALSASFALKAPVVKGIGSLLLCGLSMFILFQTSQRNGCTAIRWRFELKDWAQMALTVHAIYFGLIHDLVSK